MTDSVAQNRPRAENRQESSDGYSHVVVVLNHAWRVIECRDRIQWIIQRRRGDEWRGRHYCRTRSVLIRLCDASCGLHDPAHLTILLALPVRIGAV